MTTPPAITPVTLETALNNQNANIRKPGRGGLILGRWPSGAIIESLVAPENNIAIPPDYEGVGRLNEDGLTMGKENEVAEMFSWGAVVAVRRDIRRQNQTVQAVMQETKRLTYEITTEQDLRAKTMSTDGEVVIDHPDRPETQYWRGLALGADGDGANRFYLAKFWPKMNVSELGEETWNDQEDGLVRDVTLAATLDDEAGFLCREMIFGPGALAAAERMGFQLAA